MIVVPGIREHITFAEKFIDSRYKFQVEFYRPAWKKGKSLSDLERDLKYHIHERNKERQIALVATSSGAPLVIDSDVIDEVDKLIFTCGRMRGWRKEGLAYKVANWRNKMYVEAVRDAEGNLAKLTPAQRGKIMTMTPLFDFQAPPGTCIIEGARNEKIPFGFHAGSIAIAMMMRKKITNFILD